MDNKINLKNMTIIVDSREKVNQHITTYLDRLPCHYETKKLDFGDYSAKIQLDNQIFSLEDKVVIERKASLEELSRNITKDRLRFEREFQRAKDKNAKVFLFVENATGWLDIKYHNYKTNLNPKSFRATLYSWQSRYNITIDFMPRDEIGEHIKGTLHYALRDYLIKNGLKLNN